MPETFERDELVRLDRIFGFVRLTPLRPFADGQQPPSVLVEDVDGEGNVRASRIVPPAVRIIYA